MFEEQVAHGYFIMSAAAGLFVDSYEINPVLLNYGIDELRFTKPVYPGSEDPREFYERARDRNRANARQLQALGVLPPSRSFAPIYAEVFQIGK